MNKNTTEIDLKKSDLERLSEAVGALTSFLPFPFGLASYLLGQLPFPHQIDRIAEAVKLINERLGRLSHEIIDQLGEPENLDRLQNVLNIASKTSSQEKIQRLADVFVYCLSDKAVENSQKDKITNIVAELSETEVLWLEYYRLIKYSPQPEREAFELKNRHFLSMPSHGISTEDARQKKAWREHYDSDLARHGLVITRTHTITTPDNPNGCEITEFGRIFLDVIKTAQS